MRKKDWMLVLILVIVIIGSICIGRYPITVQEVAKAIGRQGDKRHITLVWQMRLPRTLMVGLSGMTLALSGYLYQKVFQNPLVSPDLLGASSGAAVGAAFAIVFMGGMTLYVPISAFLCSLGIVCITLYLARYMQRDTLGLILAGIITTALSGALLMILKVGADPVRDLPSIEFWLMGGFYNASWQGLKLLGITSSVGIMIALGMGYQLDVLALGDMMAQSSGMSVRKVQLIAIGGATLLVSSVVALSGLVSWIGLIAPHIARLYSGNHPARYRWYPVVMAMVWGSVLLLVADIVCRTLLPTELPISVMTSLMGGIILAVLLTKQKNQRG